MGFVPSPYSDYGQSSQLEQYLPAVQAIAETVLDETRQEAVLDARVANLKELISKSPKWLKPSLRRRLRVQEAKLSAASRSVSIEREQETARRSWRVLGQVGIVAGILLAGAIGVRVIRKD